MLQVGITGGIGTGKSTVSKIFACIGIPILDTDSVAKLLINNTVSIQLQLQNQFGVDIIVGSLVDRKLLATRAFSSAKNTAILNSIVHPFVFAYIDDWVAKQRAPYCIRESALLIETGSYKNLDILVGVSAPKSLRMQRILNRDISKSNAQITMVMNQQMPEIEKQQHYHYTINNDGESLLIPQVLQVHQQLLNRI